MEIFLNSFVAVALSELGDKTQLLAFILAGRFRRPGSVLAGIFAATLLNHLLAAAAGTWVSELLSPRLLSGILAVLFAAFGVWALVPDKDDEELGSRETRHGAFLTTAFLFFLAEMGDKTQLATVALAARYRSVVLVTVGTTLGMLASDGLAVFLGEKLAERVSMKIVRRVAAGIFLVFGAVSLWAAVGR
jgi:Ca2+/H+ antiporter, TMEM165/GDT1 family